MVLEEEYETGTFGSGERTKTVTCVSFRHTSLLWKLYVCQGGTTSADESTNGTTHCNSITYLPADDGAHWTL